MQDDKRLSWLAPAAIIVLAAGLRLLQLGNENLWLDEVFQVGYSRDVSPGSIKGLSQLLLHFVLRASESEFILRLPSVVFSVGEVALIYVLTLRLFSRRTAALASLFLALSPLHVWYSQEVRWYSQWSFLSTLTFLLLLQLLDGARLKVWIGYAVVSVINMYTFILSVFVLLLQAGFSVLMPSSRQPDRQRILILLGLVQVAVIAAAGPLVWMMLGGADSPTGTPRPTRLAVLPYTFFAYVAGYSVGPSLTELHEFPSAWTVVRGFPEVLAYFVVFGGLAAAGLVRLFRHRWPAREMVLIWAVGMPLALYIIAMVLDVTYNVRYTLVSLPAVYILLGLGAGAILDGVRWRWLAVVPAVILFGFSLFNYYANSRYDKEDVRGALEHLHSVEPALPVVFAGQIAVVARYYGTPLGVGPVVDCNPESEDDPRIIEALREEPSFWLLVGRAWSSQEDDCLARLGPDLVVTPDSSFVGVDLFRVVRVQP